MMPAVAENGILMYDLAGNWCEECGRAKSFRLWPGVLTGSASPAATSESRSHGDKHHRSATHHLPNLPWPHPPR